MILSFFFLSPCFCVCITFVFFAFKFLVSLVFMLWLFNMFLFGYFLVLHFFVFHIKIKKIEKSEKYKNSVCFVYIGTCVPWMAIETKSSKLCIIYNLDEHLYVQLST